MVPIVIKSSFFLLIYLSRDGLYCKESGSLHNNNRNIIYLHRSKVSLFFGRVSLAADNNNFAAYYNIFLVTILLALSSLIESCCSIALTADILLLYMLGRLAVFEW